MVVRMGMENFMMDDGWLEGCGKMWVNCGKTKVVIGCYMLLVIA